MDVYKQKAYEQFSKRYNEFFDAEKIDNSKLMAGEPMFFYCRHCGILSDTLPEDYLFPANLVCSQCQGLDKEGLLVAAKIFNKKETQIEK